MNKLLNEVHMNLNVLGLLSVNQISSDLNGTFIVTKNDTCVVVLNTKLCEKVLNQNHFSGCINNSPILCLYNTLVLIPEKLQCNCIYNKVDIWTRWLRAKKCKFVHQNYY
jgi:hypothetical protein